MEKAFYEIKKEYQERGPYNIFVATIILLLVFFLGNIPTAVITIQNGGVLTLPMTLYSFGFIAIAMMLWTQFVDESPLQGLGLIFKGANPIVEFLKGVLSGVIILFTTCLMMYLVGDLSFTGITFSSALLQSFIIIMFGWIIQSSTEELVFRGWFFGNLLGRYSKMVAIIANSLLFMVMHLANDGISAIPVINLFLFGVVMSIYMLKTNHLWSVCGMHACWNCLQGSVFSFQVSGLVTSESFIQVQTQGATWATGGAFGLEGSIFCTISLILFLAYLLIDHLTKQLYLKNRL